MKTRGSACSHACSDYVPTWPPEKEDQLVRGVAAENHGKSLVVITRLMHVRM